jgi:hypothetical protein
LQSHNELRSPKPIAGSTSQSFFDIDQNKGFSDLSSSDKSIQEARCSYNTSTLNYHKVSALKIRPTETLPRNLPTIHYSSNFSQRQQGGRPPTSIVKRDFHIHVLNRRSIVIGTDHKGSQRPSKADLN